MKKKSIQSKKTLRNLANYKNNPGSYFDLNNLLENKFLYFEMEDYYWSYKFKSIPKGLKLKTIEVLLDVYLDWQNKLKNQDFEYYLAIWLYLPRLGLSQVVCSTKEKMNYFENEFFLLGDRRKKLDLTTFGKFSTELLKFSWDLKIDLDNLQDWEINFPKENYEHVAEYYLDQRKYRRNIKKVIKKVSSPDGGMYLFPAGDVWVGKSNPV